MNCEGYESLGFTGTGTRDVDPDGSGGHPPISVHCSVDQGGETILLQTSPSFLMHFVELYTEISHDSADEEIEVESCPSPGCFSKMLDYGSVPIEQVHN